MLITAWAEVNLSSSVLFNVLLANRNNITSKRSTSLFNGGFKVHFVFGELPEQVFGGDHNGTSLVFRLRVCSGMGNFIASVRRIRWFLSLPGG